MMCHYQRDLVVVSTDYLQVPNAVKKAEMVMAVLKKHILNRDKSVLVKLYKQLVRPHSGICYCCLKSPLLA